MWYSLVSLEQTGADRLCATITTEADAPWYDGHFPGKPVLPGVAQLEMVAELISTLLGRPVFVDSISRVKFRKLIVPGELLEIQVSRDDRKKGYVFQITNRQENVSSGILTINHQYVTSSP
jgi:3-hydroxyacyl-[acyl-carrier-protein] dehydratase